MSKKNFIYRIRRKGQILFYNVSSPEVVSKFYFKHVLGYKLNLKDPKTLNEKIQWLKLYLWPNMSEAIKCADKYAVREYLKSKNQETLLNEILFVWDSPDQIDWNDLPNQFVIKCNHGCGYNVICSNKDDLDERTVKKQLKKWMKEDFSKYNAEPHYAKIERKIICEKFLGDSITNYNLYVFNGKVTFFSVAGGLGNGEGEYLSYYMANGEPAEFYNKAYPTKKEKLSSLLPDMFKTAELLADGFPMVRVDLFDIDGKIVLSEMTFTPGGGLIPFSTIEADMNLGDMLDITKA